MLLKILTFWSDFIENYIPKKINSTDENYNKARQLVYIFIIAPSFLVVMSSLNYFLESYYTFISDYISIFFLLLTLIYFRKTAHLGYTANLLALNAYFIILVTILETGGLYSQAVNWLIIPSLLVFLYTYNFRYGFIWFLIAVLTVMTMVILDYEGYDFYDAIPPEFKGFHDAYLSISLFAFILVVVLSYTFEAQQARIIKKKNEALAYANNQLEHQKEEMELQQKLLNELNIELSAKTNSLQTQNEKLEKLYQSMTDSIVYARRIQFALLPKKEALDFIFKQHFLIYRPKNIVSGDFYWSDQIENYRFFVLADCTGHGVSGAFMTIIGNVLLNQIISENRILSPQQILENLDAMLLAILTQNAEKTINDGMDLGLIRIDTTTNMMIFASAKRPILWLENHKLHKIKASKRSIGGSRKLANKSYEVHTIPLQQKQRFFLFTDGYVDQFGDKQKHHRKLLSTRLRQYIQDSALYSMEEQHQYLTQKLEAWQGNQKQTDDILLIGFEVS